MTSLQRTQRAISYYCPQLELYCLSRTENLSSKMQSRFRNRKSMIEEKGCFLKNGAAMLEQLIHSFNGNCNPIRMYSLNELKKATNDYHCDRMTHEDWNFRLYRGVHDDQEILVKKFEVDSTSSMDPLELITNEAAIASNMSKHSNFLKLLGCCFENELPTLVYEFPEKGNLSHHIYGDGQSLSWHIKLKIAIQVADAIAYLHYGTSNKIVHRHLKTGHIFLGHDFIAKLSEFQTSVLIPSGETHVVAVVFGAPQCFAPELSVCGRYTERSDVYNFGIVLCEILTGKKAAGSETLHASLNSYQLGDILEENLQGRYMGQVTECTKLALWCLEDDPCDRPTMKEVTKRLRLIRKSS